MKSRPFPTRLELAAAVFAPLGWAVWAADGWEVATDWIFGAILTVLGLIDWRTYRLPDSLNAMLCAAGLTVAGLLAPAELPHRAAGMVIGYALLAGIAAAYRRWRHRDGLGGGDAKLLAGIGAWVSWTGLPSVLLIAALSGLAFALVRAAAGARNRRSDRIPFGPFLAVGGWLVWLYGPLDAVIR